jgi:putative ABC transport system permease protein
MRRGLDSLGQDLGYGIRSFRRSPAFTLVALLSLTLGIGATTAIFSVIYGVLIAPYPYARPGEIWAPEVRAIDGRGGRPYRPDELRGLAQIPAFSDVMATSFDTVLMTGEFAPESFGAPLLTGNAFNFLGVPPVVGRTIQPSDIRGDGLAEPVVVLSYKLWLRLFDGNPAAVGRALVLNGRPHTILGVMPPRFGWYGNDSFWLPLAPARTELPFVNPIMRLAAGVSKVTAEEQLKAFNKQLAIEKPSTFPPQGFTTTLRNYLDVTVASGEMRTSLQLLLGAVGLLLLIACANVANLQLARATARTREMAVRMSIGAGRRRLVRQLLTESVVLSLIGGALGVLFAFGATRTIVNLMPEFYVPNEARVAINMPVLAFTAVVAVLTGILFGLVPALRMSRPAVADALKAGRSTGFESDGRRSRSALVIAEVTLSVVLLVSAGLMVRTFFRLTNIDPGISQDRVMLVGLPLTPSKYLSLDQRNQFAEQLLGRVGTLPGVESASIGHPFGGPQSAFAIAGAPLDDSKRVTINLVGANHLRTFAIPLRAGRMFDESEVRRGDRVAVINEAAVTLFPPGENPIGASVKLDLFEHPPARALTDAGRGSEVTIIGIVGNTRNAGIRNEPTPVVALPFSVVAPLQRMLAIRSAIEPARLTNSVRTVVRQMDSEQPLARFYTVQEILGQEIDQPRFTMALFSAFAILGLTLAGAGIYSVLSFHVLSRTQELGVRMALGAPRRHVLGLMLVTGGRLVIVGLIVGTGVSLAATRMLRSQLFGVAPTDPLSYIGVAILLAAVALAACYIPARRAANVDPIVALRQE